MIKNRQFRKTIFVIVALMGWGCIASNAFAQSYSKSNGVISYTINQNGVPMISTLSILGTQVMPYDNVGAGFQMTGRSSAGNAYNPTQAGDCTQQPSQTLALEDNWINAGLGMASSASFSITVRPRNYNETSSCLGDGALLPYTFQFASTLGDGSVFPREVAIIDMFYTRNEGSEVLDRAQSEAPSIFPSLNVFQYAYWSPDGVNMYPFQQRVNVPIFGPRYTNDMRKWPKGVNYNQNGKVIMACTSGDTQCIALYSEQATGMLMSARQGQTGPLALLTLTLGNGSISDFSKHHARKLLLVGNKNTVIWVIASARSKISYWGDL